jgi:hypothetical protein
MPQLIIRSGGQTGADRAALDWAINNGIEHCGWCPKGRRSEDGKINIKYLLTETYSYRYMVRTRKNVEDSDGTVLFSVSPVLTGGTLLTYQWAVKMNKPTLCIHANTSEPGSLLRDFLEHFQISDLNVAGPRRTTEPQIGELVNHVLTECFSMSCLS